MGKKSKHISVSLRLLEDHSRVRKDVCHIADAYSGFVWMDGIGNADNTPAETWVLLG